MDIQTALKRSNIFRGFSADDLALVLSLGQPLSFNPGDVILREGDVGSYLYVVLDGSVSIHTGDKCLARCRAYEAFGEMAAFGKRRRSATVRAVTDLEVFLLDEAALARLLEGPGAVPFLMNVVQILCERLNAGNTWIACSLDEQRRDDGRCPH